MTPFDYTSTRWKHKRLAILRRDRLVEAQEQLADVEEYISSVRDIKVRRMIVLRYVDGLTWRQVAKRMYGSPRWREEKATGHTSFEPSKRAASSFRTSSSCVRGCGEGMAP